MKGRLAYAWREAPAGEAVPALVHALDQAPPAMKRAAYRLHFATVVAAHDLVHHVYVMHDAEARRSLVTWVGRGVRTGTVMMVEGLGLDNVRRRIESGAVSSVPRHVPVSLHPRAPRAKAKPKAGKASVSRFDAPGVPRLRPPP